MTDREMLELAAKAMGYDDAEWTEKYGCIVTAKLPGFRSFWNPRADDGDCFRMETALGIVVTYHTNHVMSDYDGILSMRTPSSYNGDKNAARREASCMVAAMIGRGMP